MASVRFLCHFHSYLLSKLINCSHSRNFEAKINCNIIKTNVPKWRKTCTGLKFDWLHFYGPQSHILLLDHFEGPCTFINVEALVISRGFQLGKAPCGCFLCESEILVDLRFQLSSVLHNTAWSSHMTTS